MGHSVKTIEGSLIATGKKFAVVASRFNSLVVDRLISGAIDYLVRHGADTDDIVVIKSPGAWELPMTAKMVLDKEAFDAVVCLGAVIRGGTPHFDYVAAEVSKGIAALGMQYDTPLSFGVLTTDTIEQCLERAGSKQGNKGAEAAAAALEMVDLKDKISQL